jgi:hypothetical protein
MRVRATPRVRARTNQRTGQRNAAPRELEFEGSTSRLCKPSRARSHTTGALNSHATVCSARVRPLAPFLSHPCAPVPSVPPSSSVGLIRWAPVAAALRLSSSHERASRRRTRTTRHRRSGGLFPARHVGWPVPSTAVRLGHPVGLWRTRGECIRRMGSQGGTGMEVRGRKGDRTNTSRLSGGQSNGKRAAWPTACCLCVCSCARFLLSLSFSLHSCRMLSSAASL